MMTVRDVRKLTGISIRALQYYDEIGLLPPARYTEAKYWLYDDAALERLQQILLFCELEFPLKEIKRILDSPGFDRGKALRPSIITTARARPSHNSAKYIAAAVSSPKPSTRPVVPARPFSPPRRSESTASNSHSRWITGAL